MAQVTSMTPDLMGIVSKQITPDIIRSVASQLSEDRDHDGVGAVRGRAVGADRAVRRRELRHRRASPQGGDRREAARRARRESRTTGRCSRPGERHRRDHAASLIDDELGPRSNSIAAAVASATGIKPASAQKLMGGVATVAVAALAEELGRHSAPARSSRCFASSAAEWVSKLPRPVASLFNGHAARASPAPCPSSAATTSAIVTGPAIQRAGGAPAQLDDSADPGRAGAARHSGAARSAPTAACRPLPRSRRCTAPVHPRPR